MFQNSLKKQKQKTVNQYCSATLHIIFLISCEGICPAVVFFPSLTLLSVCPPPVSYVERCRRHRWRCAEITFACQDEALRRHWVASIREQIAAIGRDSPPSHARLDGGETPRVTLLFVLSSLLFSSSSRPTPTPAGLHQPVRRQAAGKTHLRGKGGAAVRPGGDRHARDW